MGKNRLRRLLDKCFKIICEATRIDIPVDMKFLSFDKLYKYFKYYTMNLGPYLKDKFEVSCKEHQYNTRFPLIEIFCILMYYRGKSSLT